MTLAKNSYSVSEVAELFNISRSHVYGLIRRGADNGGIRSVKIGKSVRIPRHDLEEFGTQIGWTFMTYECPECGRESDIPRCWTCDPEIGG